MNPLICEAIHARKLIYFYYGGGYRTVEPFCHGISTAGNEVLRAYQVGGYSRSRRFGGWRLFRVAKILYLQTTEQEFEGYREDYNPKDPQMVEICCQVEE